MGQPGVLLILLRRERVLLAWSQILMATLRSFMQLRVKGQQTGFFPSWIRVRQPSRIFWPPPGAIGFFAESILRPKS
jgi:hypothetical protein